jgi:hypothetical protein
MGYVVAGPTWHHNGLWRHARSDVPDLLSASETVQNLGVITPLNETERMLPPTFGCGILTVEESHGPSNRESMGRPAGAGPGGRDEVAGHDRTGRS